uniref:Uncharacterized protein n=1 Tax=Corethron hystrix TaxID=216773 RepID=A0A7S1BS79_9STRA|mmetsp:Transcript_36565/g.85478  ORF Transcript_36565/g.85478 Transcript_36565/m.85478 type:complete len:203 (+) Transcript_36565:148-756(+)|eukprot:CAMPEP_0113301524 /NCGR_PEP_ID=MMETSP0010_2-20120614/2722_1 /TAXON_ID=216773 ORGANISM="Corethron hystrix, Strain 308" /NCGR_SAMPLE_ID=MMETSP0010_2 /ASSEMBLY_ACC=CAM_ASM_000155 /LENGTH=202 /DNA_ID=CAMNT_0000155171 /DNA_START=51 /DNA_END=659 /DNA_ORIENTATION=- /assembly_acc=CAM_ASM_000155
MKFLLTAILAGVVSNADALTVSSTSTIKGRSAGELQTFLATPTNWPSIVASSFGVEEADTAVIDGSSSPFFPLKKAPQANAINRPLKKGDRVKEIFGLPPILPLDVTWTCEENVTRKANKRNGSVNGGNLAFFSADGLGGIAKNCRMSFSISEAGEDGNDTTVDMNVEIEPVNPIANLAPAILKVDNDLALKILLPLALKKA